MEKGKFSQPRPYRDEERQIEETFRQITENNTNPRRPIKTIKEAAAEVRKEPSQDTVLIPKDLLNSPRKSPSRIPFSGQARRTIRIRNRPGPKLRLSLLRRPPPQSFLLTRKFRRRNSSPKKKRFPRASLNPLSLSSRSTASGSSPVYLPLRCFFWWVSFPFLRPETAEKRKMTGS